MTKINFSPIVFGKDAIQSLGTLIKKQKFQKALLVSGKGSIKRSGLYDQIYQQTKNANIEVVEFFGIKPNPTNIQVNKASQLGLKEKVDLVIAAGGGSVIDAAKVIAAMIANPEIKDIWDVISKKTEFVHHSIGVVSIITLAGTASENNAISVVTNEELALKRSTITQAPILAIEDPTYTYSVSPWQTASGIFDACSHLMEQYFTIKGSLDWTDNYIFGLLKTLIKNGPIAVKEPHNYNARANILFSTTMALNGLASLGAVETDWSVHKIAHAIAGKYDTTHGATLALITPTYLKKRLQEPLFAKRLTKLGKAVFNVNSAQATIEKIINFIKEINLPEKYSDFKVLANLQEQDLIDFINLTGEGYRLSKKALEEVYRSIPR